MRILEIRDECGLIHEIYIKDEWTVTLKEEFENNPRKSVKMVKIKDLIG